MLRTVGRFTSEYSLSSKAPTLAENQRFWLGHVRAPSRVNPYVSTPRANDWTCPWSTGLNQCSGKSGVIEKPVPDPQLLVTKTQIAEGDSVGRCRLVLSHAHRSVDGGVEHTWVARMVRSLHDAPEHELTAVYVCLRPVDIRKGINGLS